MSTFYLLFTIILVALATMLTRFLPFLLFPASRKAPDVVVYLGQVLPGAVFGLLVIYCLKNVDLTSGSHGLPEAIAIIVVILIHQWKGQMLLSIAAGTLLYMFLVQSVFI